MSDRLAPDFTEPSRRKRRLRLWHLVVAVLLSALVFGGIRCLIVGQDRRVVETLSLGLSLLILPAMLVSGFVFGSKLGNRTGLAFLEWGERRGGLAGFFAQALGILAYILAGIIGIVMGALAIALVIGLIEMALGGP